MLPVHESRRIRSTSFSFTFFIGIGVRVLVYFQAWLSVTTAFIVLAPGFVTRWRTDAVLKSVPEALCVLFEYGMSNQVTSVSLIISAIIQAKTFSFSMYHAFIVLNLSWILTMSMCCSFLTNRLYLWGDHSSLVCKGHHITLVTLGGAISKRSLDI